MNILVPDSWLREYLKTKATPKQIKENLSLCGPSVERINKVGQETVYDIEITSNRPDAMSVVGVAREAAAILPRFGIPSKLVEDPYKKGQSLRGTVLRHKSTLKLLVKTDPALNPRWTSVIFENVKIGPSPRWLRQQLELVGVRPLNNVIDITNYLMHAYGQPAHVFDYDAIKGHVMTLRTAKKHEHLTTLDGKTHTLPGGDIVIADASGKLIDLCGIMGGENSAVKATTTRVILFLQNYDPVHIRKTSMSLAHRTEAANLFEKGTDPELVWPVFLRGINLMQELTHGRIASKVTDIYHSRYQPVSVSVSREKVDIYLGTKLKDTEIKGILTDLGFATEITKNEIKVKVPSWRRDVTIDVDIIEEIARLYGYHKIINQLPEGQPPIVLPDPELNWEEEVKIRLRDWGFTELYTYSMIPAKLMDIFGLDKSKAYKISNPLSEEWVYLRPHLFPSVLENVRQNLNIKNSLKLFELSMAYHYRPNDLPLETPTLIVVWTGNKFLEAKGLAEELFKLFGIEFPNLASTGTTPPLDVYGLKQLTLGEFGSLGEINSKLLTKLGIQSDVTRLYLDFTKLVSRANPAKKYTPVPKYPSSYEDLAFIVQPQTSVGQLILALSKADHLVTKVELLDSFENTRTFHITYQDPQRNLTNEDLKTVREKLIRVAQEKFGAILKSL